MDFLLSTFWIQSPIFRSTSRVPETPLWSVTSRLGAYTEIVARGWESKSVEDQIEAAQNRKQSAPRLSADEIAKQTKVDSLLLQRTRVLRDLEKSRKVPHQAVLTAGLEYLERQLAELGWVARAEERSAGDLRR